MRSVRLASSIRPRSAFSSFAVTVAFAVVAIIGVACGGLQDSKANSDVAVASRAIAMAEQR